MLHQRAGELVDDEAQERHQPQRVRWRRLQDKA
jgi:hypothetical protein